MKIDHAALHRDILITLKLVDNKKRYFGINDE